MYDIVELDDLKQMVSDSESAKELNMSHWWCGTAGCLVGTFCRSHPTDRLQVIGNSGDGSAYPVLSRDVTHVEAVVIRFGLSYGIGQFLFDAHRTGECRLAATLSKEDAIARLRKYVRYVERKRALWADHEWLMSLSRRDRETRMAEMWNWTGRSYALAETVDAAGRSPAKVREP